MTYAARVDSNGLLTLPQELCQRLGLTANLEVELEQSDDTIRLSPKAEADMRTERHQRMLKDTEFYLGLQREHFLREGWSSVDEYIADMRGR